MEDEPPLGAEHLAGSTGEGEPSGFAGSHPVARADGVLAVAENVPLFFWKAGKVPLAVAKLCPGRQVPRLHVVDVHLGDGSAVAQVV